MVVQQTAAAPSRGSRVISAPAVSLTGVVTGYVENEPAVSVHRLEVPSRGTTRLTGRNGVGKSTLIEVISGFLPAWSGEIAVLGHRPDDPALRSRRRTLRTAAGLFPYMTVRDHLSVASRAHGIGVEASILRAERLGLGSWLDENAIALSSGSAKKLWYVISTTGEADLYLLDEPFNAIDDDGIDVIVDEIHAFARHSAVLLVCHSLPPQLQVDEEVSIA